MKLKIFVVDDEYLSLEGTVDIVKKILPDADVHGFRDAEEALDFAKKEVPSLAFLDIETRSISGIEIARQLKELNPNVNIVFVTGYSNYMEDAFALHASGYVMKPMSKEKIRKEILNLRFPLMEKKVRVRTFGSFEVFINDMPVFFNYTKTKELFAILIDACGSLLSVNTIINILWDDDDGDAHKSYFRNLVADLKRIFSDDGLSDVIINRRGYLGVNCSKISCDYFDFLGGNQNAISLFNFEYMSQYSWAENTLGLLVSKKEK
ncbi:MAG: response regulator [Treponema sp.]|nr:response regulator [Treponema sp.]